MKHILLNCCKGNLFQYLSSITAAFSVVSSGINLGWTSPYLPKLQSENSKIPTTNEEGSWCAIAPLVGAPFGAILTVFLVDKLGRKNTMLFTSPIVLASFIGIAFSRTIWEITACRLIIGGAEGALYTALPMYIGEISDPAIRGFLSSTIAIAGICGTLFINIIGSLLDIFSSSLICALVSVIHFCTFIFMPESPYFYIKNGRYESAKESLRILRGRSDVVQEIDDITKAVIRQEQTSGKASFLDLFTVSSNRKACFIFVIVNLTNKFSGKNPSTFYTETIFREAGITMNASLSVIIYTSIELVTICIASYFIVDRFGKKILLVASTTGCTICVFFLSVNFYLKDFHLEIYAYVKEWLPITALILYNIFFNIGLSFGMVMVLSELFPTNVKAKALGIADSFSVIAGSIVTKFFQISMDEFGTMAIPFFCFSICCGIGLILIIKYLPETKGKTLEEIQQLLIGQKNIPMR